MIKTTHGGPVEDIAAVLVVIQFLFAWTQLKRRRARWPRPAFLAAVTSLALLYGSTLASLWFTWSGAMYKSDFPPLVVRTAIVAAGLFWIFLSTLTLAIVICARMVLARIPGMHSAARRQWLAAAGVAAVAAPAGIAVFGVVVERNRYRIRELDFPVAGLHPDLEGFRISQVTDLHVSPFLSAREAGRVIDMANELRADLALFTGDLISEMGDPLDDAIRELTRLEAPMGVLCCMGNHEAYVGCRDYLAREASRAGLLFLRHAATQIRRGQGILNIAGVDYQRKEDPGGYLPGAERLVVPGVSNILLSHNPDTFPTAIRRGFQGVIAGHTHGGQVNVEILHQNINPARFRTPFTSGLYRLDNASCFVSNGIGTIGMPIRLGAPPEIALLRLRRA